MKRNVDLTQNRIFSSARPTARDIGLFVFRPVELGKIDSATEVIKLHPWAVDKFQRVHSDADLCDGNSEEIIITGNASTRAHKKYWKAADAGDMCDCCGTDLNKKPWDRHYCLCSSCMDRLDVAVAKNWQYKDDSIENSVDRLVLEMNFRPF